jgi:DNA replicative helicase MCM subunit Mcm2 (Cdc46/Mcm family)
MKKIENEAVERHVAQGNLDFTMAFYNYQTVTKIRELRTNDLGRLMEIRGTVTR